MGTAVCRVEDTDNVRPEKDGRFVGADDARGYMSSIPRSQPEATDGNEDD
jgi:hypothetical protein